MEREEGGKGEREALVGEPRWSGMLWVRQAGRSLITPCAQEYSTVYGGSGESQNRQAVAPSCSPKLCPGRGGWRGLSPGHISPASVWHGAQQIVGALQMLVE